MRGLIIVLMESVSSIFRVKNLNPPIDGSAISRIVSVPTDPANPQLSSIYFYGADDQGREKIVRVWFYSSKVFREQELARIRQTHPHIPILA